MAVPVDSPATTVILALATEGTGGIERAVRDLTRAVDIGIRPGQVRVLTLREVNNGARVSYFRRLQFVVSCVRRTADAGVIISAHPHLAPIAFLAARLNQAPYAVVTYGIDSWSRRRLLVHFALRRADRVWSISEFTAATVRQVHGISASRIRILKLAIPSELSREEPRPTGKRVLSVGRLTYANAYKGADTLLLAWSHVLRAAPEAELVFIGDGDDRPRLESLARHLGITSTVRFAGRVDDAALASAYSTASVFALPGRAWMGRKPAGEGFGLVFVEAAAAGLPVVAGDAAGAREAIRDGITGFLVEPNNPELVARAVIDLLNDPERARNMGKRGREWASEQFAYERFRRDVGTLIADLSNIHPSNV